jgi:hypothetical protein
LASVDGVGRFDDHPFASGAREVLPPGDARVATGRVCEVDCEVAGGPERVWIDLAELVENVEMPEVTGESLHFALGGQHLEWGETEVIDAVHGPAARGPRILEEAVRLITDVPARFYGLRDRGRLVEGAQGDIVLFDPTTIGPGTPEIRTDLPAHGTRLFSQPDGIQAVLVNGTEVVVEGKPNGAVPGRVLRSGRDTRTVSLVPSRR